MEIIRRNVSGDPSGLFPKLDPVLARIYAARSITGMEGLDYSLSGLPSPEGLSGMEEAVDLLFLAIRDDQRILVVADFDADGATSCAVAVRGLRALGARQVEFVVPNRFEYGYGLTPEIVAVAARGSPDLLVTVDNGISSLAGVAAAREAGMRVLITDHHLPGAELPAADAIVNPQLCLERFDGPCLAGVGVIFYVLLGLRARLRELGWYREAGREEPNLAVLLDLVALGTVADVVPLDRTNRILVEQGLRRIRAGRAQPGVRALLEVGRRNPAEVVASDLGFAVGPRLNAAGRLTDMGLGIDCLLCDETDAAFEMARKLDDLNNERRDIEGRMKEQAVHLLRDLYRGLDDTPAGVCLFREDWHQGVIGILASRVRERLHRPVIAFAPGGDGELRGSARSVSGLHVRDALDAVATRNPGLITRFGGHAMAAGLSLPSANLEAFSRAFDEQVRSCVSEDELRGRLHTDGSLPDSHLGLEFAEYLRLAGPWGQAFPEPVFDGDFKVMNRRIVGGNHVKLQLGAAVGRPPIDAIAFNRDEGWLAGARQAYLAYRLDVNVYRGCRQAQLVIEHGEPR